MDPDPDADLHSLSGKTLSSVNEEEGGLLRWGSSKSIPTGLM
jgi:hypothetical protein